MSSYVFSVSSIGDFPALRRRVRCLLLFCLAIAGLESTAAQLGETAPDFTLKNMVGDNVRLEEHRGDVLLVNFWASWCGPCRQEMPILERIHNRYENAGFKVLGVNVDKKEDKARKIAERSGVTFPLLLDTQQQVSEQYGLEGMPYTVLIDRDGNIRYIHTGYKPGDEQQYINKLKTLLRES